MRVRRLPRHRALFAVVPLAAILACVWYGALAGPAEIALQPGPSAVFVTPAGALRAGAAKEDITPAGSVHLAGFAQGRMSEGVHDPLYARALVLEAPGGERVALLSLDLIGLSITDTRRIRAAVREVPPERVVVCATHDHEGPDTLGFWGEAFVISGRDEAYMSALIERAARAVDRAARALRPARARTATREVPPGIATDIRGDGHDPLVRALALEDAAGGATIATLLHFGMHAEALWSKNRLITADWPGYACARTEERRGGTAVVIQGALGGMVTIDFAPGERGTFAAAERAGRAVADAALDGLAAAPVEDALPLALARTRALIPSNNRFFNLFWELGKLDRPARGGQLETEVTLLRIGRLALFGLPGEVLPRPAREIEAVLAAAAPGEKLIAGVIGLADDELGYLLAPAQWDDPRYAYERGWSPSRRAIEVLAERTRVLAERVFATAETSAATSSRAPR
jgi:hypothetical protein